MDNIVTVKEYDYYERQKVISKLCDKYKFINWVKMRRYIWKEKRLQLMEKKFII